LVGAEWLKARQRLVRVGEADGAQGGDLLDDGLHGTSKVIELLGAEPITVAVLYQCESEVDLAHVASRLCHGAASYTRAGAEVTPGGLRADDRPLP
jgi:hypothetical protein